MTATIDTFADFGGHEPGVLGWEFLCFPGVEVIDGEIDRDPCRHCQTEDVVCTVRVIDDPAPEYDPIQVPECCGLCALGLVERAVGEQDPRSRTPIRVEIAR